VTAIEALHRHRRCQLVDQLRLGDAWQDQDFVFPNAIGGYQRAATLRDRWTRLAKRAGLPSIRFHDLRHTAATLLLARGVNIKVVSEMLGHASISITLSIYGHVLPHMQQQAAEMMDRVLGR
jgi:integrase